MNEFQFLRCKELNMIDYAKVHSISKINDNGIIKYKFKLTSNRNLDYTQVVDLNQRKEKPRGLEKIGDWWICDEKADMIPNEDVCAIPT